MLDILVSAVMWPPGYYIWRDRAPFFLSVLFILYRDPPRWLPTQVFSAWGWYLSGITTLGTGAAVRLYLNNSDMSSLAGIVWSAPSPIEWGTVIIAITGLLHSREIPIFEAYYLAFITALSGGWLYEFTPLLFQSNFNYFVFFKINAVKVFFIEFQLFCLPILVYLIKTTKQYQQSRLLIPAGLFLLAFSALNQYVIQWVQANLLYSYKWYVRLPAILFLFTLVYGIKGETPHV